MVTRMAFAAPSGDFTISEYDPVDTSIIDAVTPILELLIASLTSVSEVAPVVREKVEEVPLAVNAGPADHVPKSIVRLSIPISAVVDEKPLPPLLSSRPVRSLCLKHLCVREFTGKAAVCPAQSHIARA